MLELIDLKKEYEHVVAIDHIHLEIGNGEKVAIVGESGCGKSTLAKMIARIENVDAGTIVFNNQDIAKIPAKDFYRKVQIIFQHPLDVLSPRMRIGDFLMEPWINFEKLKKKDAKKKALKSLEQVHLPFECFDKYPHMLSGGELQRVVVARAIALKPELLICDEMTSALDVSIQKDIMNLLNEIHQELNCTIVFISHDLALAESFCDRIVIMYEGKIKEIVEGGCLLEEAKDSYTIMLLQSVLRIHD